ncbi:serine protease [Iodidimonas gelatinilytica]|uniref:Probable periplasmic serine endoprotease DegP-like n=1 Tax=Iodidimonas gelatinilytica TaxID=1236966 RepID=A0A5A7N1Q3_9PROT|nr:DegQ family serine endoprotease [Iodidimonas gelatinilytica]GEQ97771.1 serine protease [Iodidimonas gelatinilytica]GER01280.1 serine protease [Iodidimonas gelatinilytica]
MRPITATAKAQRPSQAGKTQTFLAFSLVLMSALVISMLLAFSAHARQMPESFADLVEKLSPAVVNISSVQTVEARSSRSPFPPGSPFEDFFEEFLNRGQPNGSDEPQTRKLQSLGSGFIIDAKGLVVTNNHVIESADEVTVRTVDGEEYEAEVIGRDAEGDLALLRIQSDEDFPFVQWGSSSKARVGDWVLSIGNPFGLGGSVTAGIISAHHRQISGGPFDDFIQTDASINRGNSGGPLFDLDGNVIGINTAIFSPTGGNVGIAFAIPSDQARKVIAQIEEFGYARRGYLGVQIQPVDRMTADALGLDDAKGALVNSVTPDSPAEKAGVEDGDIIIEFNGEKVEDSAALVKVVSSLGVEEKATLTILRGGDRKTLSVVTGERPRPEDSEDPAQPSVTEELGMELSDLNGVLRQQFNVPDDVNGALVLQVAPDLRQRVARGDVIVEVNRKPVETSGDVSAAIADIRAEGRSAALLRLYRNGDFYFIPIPLGGDE